jgi:hypothetical protein
MAFLVQLEETPASAIECTIHAVWNRRPRMGFGSDVNPELNLPKAGFVFALPLPGTSLLLALETRGTIDTPAVWVIRPAICKQGRYETKAKRGSEEILSPYRLLVSPPGHHEKQAAYRTAFPVFCTDWGLAGHWSDGPGLGGDRAPGVSQRSAKVLTTERASSTVPQNPQNRAMSRRALRVPTEARPVRLLATKATEAYDVPRLKRRER